MVALTDLNDDLLLVCLVYLCDDIRDVLALSSVCKRLHALGSDRSTWGKLYDTHGLSIAFGSKSNYPSSTIKFHVIRYLKTLHNLESSTPKPSSYKFYPVNATNDTIQNTRQCLLYGRFLFQVAGSGGEPITVACFDMDDGLRLLWKRTGEWVDWGMLFIRSCEITHCEDSKKGSQMSVLMQAAGRNLLHLRTLGIKYLDRSVELYDVQSRFFEVQDPSVHAPFVHQGKWILRAKPPLFLTEIDSLRNYLETPHRSNLDSCSFAGEDHIITKSNEMYSTETKIGIFKISRTVTGMNNVEPDKRNEDLVIPMQTIGLTYLSGPSPSCKATSTPNMSFLTWVGCGTIPELAIVNVLSSPDTYTSKSVSVLTVDHPRRFTGVPSQHRGWVFGFGIECHIHWSCRSPRNLELVFSRLQPSSGSGGGLEFGPVKQVSLPEDVVGRCTHPIKNCVFDEFCGRLYFTTRNGLYVVDFA